MRRPLPRRRFLRLSTAAPLGLAGWLQAACAPPERSTGAPRGGGDRTPSAGAEPITVPRVNGGLNVQPARCLGCDPVDQTIDPAVVGVQLSAVYELGFDGIRVTAPLGDRGSFLAAIPYVRTARALGIDAVVLLADFSGLTLARALHDERKRADVLRMYRDVFAPAPEPVRPGLGGLGPRGTGRIAFQVLNEPAGFVGLPPDVYVREILAPCFNDLKAIDPGVIVVSAAEAGVKDGPPRIRAMLEAGLEFVCDRIGYHVYTQEIIPLLGDHVRQIVWVTESGVSGVQQHLSWVRDVFPQIRSGIPDSLRIFYYDLYDPAPGAFRVLSVERVGSRVVAIVESRDLHEHWAAEVHRAAGSHPLIGFSALVPDVTAYFPTEADMQAYDSAPWQ
jgi:hypothetical protein